MNLGDYVDVPTRFRLALDKWPEMRVVEVPTRFRLALDKWPEMRVVEEPAKIVTIGDRTFISVTMTVYRDPSDPLPCVATCWETFPGTTPYVRNSEQMNCSTSALGRALGMMIPFGKMASFEEVQNRQAETVSQDALGGTQKRIVTTTATASSGEVWPVSKKQLQELSALGYGGAVPANWNEAKAIIARMSIK